MAGGITEIQVTLSHKKIKLDQSPSIIQFKIHPRSTHHEILNQHEKETLIMGSSVQIQEAQFLSDEHMACTKVLDMLPSSLKIDSLTREWLILEIIAKTCVILHENFTRVNMKWLIEVKIHLTTKYGHIREVDAKTCGRMVRAKFSSIAALKEEKLDDHVGDKCCAICLSEFPVGSLVTRMPCLLHIFHHECIAKWLNTSHTCPTCRYEMPAEKVYVID